MRLSAGDHGSPAGRVSTRVASKLWRPAKPVRRLCVPVGCGRVKLSSQPLQEARHGSGEPRGLGMKALEAFVEGLCRIPERDFTIDPVASYLAQNPVDPDGLTPYLHYASTHYTRNLIYKCELFEL